jgi:hypothetical protein
VRAGRLIQVAPHAIQDDPRESKCKGVTPGAADALGKGGFSSRLVSLYLFSSSISSLFVSFVHLEFTSTFLYLYESTVSYRSSAIFRDYGVAEAPPDFQAGWSDCMYFFSLFLFFLFTHLEFPCKFLYP